MVNVIFIESSCLILRVIGDVNITPEDDYSINIQLYF